MVRAMCVVLIVALEIISSSRIEAQPQLPPLRVIPVPHPGRLAVDANLIYTVDPFSHQVLAIDTAGNIRIVASFSGQFPTPTDVAVDSDGNLYVADSANARVQKFDPSTGASLGSFGEAGQGPGQFFNGIKSLALDAANNVYVGSTFQLQKFTPDGIFQEAFPLGGILPIALAVDQSNNLIFFEKDNGTIDKRDQAGTLLAQFAPAGCDVFTGFGCSTPEGDGELGIGGAGAIAVDRSGNIYVADSRNARIQKFSPNGTFLWKFGSPGTGEGQFGLESDGPQGIAVDDAGRIYVADTENNRILVFAQPAPVSLAIDNVTVTEGDTGTKAAVFTVTLTPASSQAVTVDYATEDQSTQAGTDYTSIQGTLTFAPGDTTKTLSVEVHGDTTIESNERFVVHLSHPNNATLGTAQGIGEILNDDRPFARCQNVTVPTSVDVCTATAASIDNGSSSPDGSTLTLTQTPAGPYSLGTTNVTLTATAGSLSDTCTATVTVEDRQAPTLSCPDNQTVTIQSGNSALVNFPSPQARDNCPTLMTSCTPPSGSLFPRGNSTVTCATTDGAGLQQSCSFNVQVIVNDQVPELRIDDATITESDNRRTAVRFTVTLSKPSLSLVTVQYATADGTAERNRDYDGTRGTIRFRPGETSSTVMVNVIGDHVPEADETFVVNLSNASGAFIGKGQGLGTILNDDGPRVLISDGISNTRGREGDNGMTTYTFAVTLSQPSGLPVTVQYATTDGTAVAGSDYVATNGTLTFQRRETRKIVTVNVVGDTTPELDETFTINLSNASGATIFDDQGIGNIVNDD